MKYFAFTILILLATFQIAYYYPKLPDTVANHFGPLGQADSFTSKESFSIISLVLIGFLSITFAGIILAIRLVPQNFINLPKKDYWFTPERSAKTKNYITNWMLIFASATLIFLMITFQLVIIANLNETNKLSMPFFWISLGIYLAYTIIASTMLVLKFFKTGTDTK